MMKNKSITKNYLYNLSYQILVLLIPLLTVPYLTKILGAEKLGIYSFTYSIVTIFFLISVLGVNTYGQREIAYVQDNRTKRTKIFWELMIVKLFASLLSMTLLCIFIAITSRYSIYYKIFLIYVFANLFDITWLYQGIEDFKDVALRNAIIKLLYFISIFIFIKTKNDLWIYILLYSLSTLITNLSFWINCNKIIDKPPKKLDYKRHIVHVFTFFIPQVASLVYTVLDKTMIGIIIPNISEVSFYEQATYIVKTILMLITTLGTVMVSRVSNCFENNNHKEIKKYITNSVTFTLCIGSALMFGICAIISHIVPWFYGNEYSSVIKLIYYLAPLIIIIGLSNIIGIQYLVSIKKQNYYIGAVICGAIINFILNIILLNLLGTIGAAIASVASELMILIIELNYTKKVITGYDIIKSSIKYLLFGIIMFITIYIVGKNLEPNILNTCILTILGIIIYMLLLIVSKDSIIMKIKHKKNISN